MASRSFLSRRGDSLAFLLGRETYLSSEHLKAHDDDAKHHEHHAGGAVERFGCALLAKTAASRAHSSVKTMHSTHVSVSGMPPMAKWETAPVSAVKVMIKTLVPTAVFSS